MILLSSILISLLFCAFFSIEHHDCFVHINCVGSIRGPPPDRIVSESNLETSCNELWASSNFMGMRCPLYVYYCNVKLTWRNCWGDLFWPSNWRELTSETFCTTSNGDVSWQRWIWAEFNFCSLHGLSSFWAMWCKKCEKSTVLFQQSDDSWAKIKEKRPSSCLSLCLPAFFSLMNFGRMFCSLGGLMYMKPGVCCARLL